MQKTNKKELSYDKKWYMLEILMTATIGVLISLLLVLLAAFLIKTFSIPSDYIMIFTIVIKILSILIAGIICLKRSGGGWIRGAVAGILYTLVSFFIFSLLGGEFGVNLTLLNDTALGMVAGAITGILAVNLRANR